MDRPLLPASVSGDPSAWDQALYAFLVEKGNRSGSGRTVESYGRILWPFFAAKSPDKVTAADVLAFAHRIGHSGRPPSANTIRARIACLSSFYRFGIRMGLLASNPCDPFERPRTQAAPPGGTPPKRSAACWRSCLTPSQAGATGPSSSPSSLPGDGGRRSSAFAHDWRPITVRPGSSNPSAHAP